MKVVFIENGEVVAERNIPYPPNLPQNDKGGGYLDFMNNLFMSG